MSEGNWLRFTFLEAKPWFERYGLSLNDIHSFKIMRDMVSKEIAENEPFVEEFKGYDLIEASASLAAEIEESKALLVNIDARIQEIHDARLG